MEIKVSKKIDDVSVSFENEREQNGILFIDVKMVFETELVPQPLTISFKIPAVDIYSIWSPSNKIVRNLGPNWSKRQTTSRLASGMPLHTVLSAKGRNRLTVALSDAMTPTTIATGVWEEDACLECAISFFTMNIAPIKEYKATLRIDMRDMPYYDSVTQVSDWWENECGYTPAYVPEHAKLPMNSLWYSYHQKLDVEDIIEECKLSKALGMDTVIVDDGWQTDDNNRGYAYCGDWEVATSKIPDMKEFVRRVHETGMKIMLWYSVPFVGIYSKNYERFKTMFVNGNETQTTYTLDPRYKEVRDFLIENYSRAIRDWDLDGLKLDFIDSFILRGSGLEYDARRDHHSLEEAINTLMTDVSNALRAIKKDVLIEFRQSYVGPAIRQYGNMLRVADCPNDALLNRVDGINLRLTSGSTAVHSDMLMWHKDDTVESAAMQFVAAIYTVPQISVKIATMSDEHKKMLKYYLTFWREHRDTLIEGKILAANPESVYSLVCAEKDGKAIFTAYTDTVIDCSDYKDEVIALNASRSKTLIIKAAKGRGYRVVNCMGEVLEEGSVEDKLFEVNVPFSGMIFIK